MLVISKDPAGTALDSKVLLLSCGRGKKDFLPRHRDDSKDVLRSVIILIVVAASAMSARADVDVGQGVPFSPAQLQAAIDARTAPPIPPVAVRAGVPGTVVVTVGGVERIVPTGDQRGEDAARLVALHVVDLIAPVRSSPAALAAPAALAGRAGGDARSTSPAARWRLRASSGGGRGLSQLDPWLVSGALDIDAVFERWRIGAGVVWWHALVEVPGTIHELRYDTLLLRARVAAAIGPFEIAAGPNVGTFQVGAIRQVAGALVGAGAEVRSVWRLTGRWHLVATAAADAVHHRVNVSANGDRYATTPYATLLATVGVAWESGR